MTVTRLSNTKLKITLDKEESSLLFKHGAYPAFSDPNTLKTLRFILKKAARKTGFLENPCRLYVEIYPLIPSGVIIYFTKPDREADADGHTLPTYVISFKNFDNIPKLCRFMSNRHPSITDSRLFKHNGAYHIIMDTPLLQNIPTIKEFADHLCCSKLTAAIISEYGKPILLKNAIDVLSNLSRDF